MKIYRGREHITKISPDGFFLSDEGIFTVAACMGYIQFRTPACIDNNIDGEYKIMPINTWDGYDIILQTVMTGLSL